MWVSSSSMRTRKVHPFSSSACLSWRVRAKTHSSGSHRYLTDTSLTDTSLIPVSDNTPSPLWDRLAAALFFLSPSKLVQQIICIIMSLLSAAVYLCTLMGLLWLDSGPFNARALQSVRHVALSVWVRDQLLTSQMVLPAIRVCMCVRAGGCNRKRLDDLKVSYSPSYVFSCSSNGSKGERADQWTGCGWTSPLAQPLAGLFRAPGSGVSHCRFSRQPW